MNPVANGNGAGRRSSAAGVAAPMAREAEAKFRIGEAVRRWCFQSLGPRLQAVILTGSLARQEATSRPTEDGLQFLSDAEFIVIVKDREELPSQELVTLICSAAEDELRNQGVLCKISFSAAYESYLSGFAETIFGYELLHCGEVLYGEPGILANKAHYTEQQISAEDGWRLLANRTVELLEIAPQLLEGRTPLPEAAQYRLTKLYCDMVTSILVLKHEFVTGYQARTEKLFSLQKSGQLLDLPVDLDWFLETVQGCTDYKIGRSAGAESLFATPAAIQQTIGALCSLWAWELAQINGVAMSTAGAMLRLHMRRQSLRDRLRGWAFAVRRRGVLEALRNTGHWLRLMILASPRYCVYAAALDFWSQFAVSGTEPQVANGSKGAPEINSQTSHQQALASLETSRSWLPVGHPLVHNASNMEELAEAILWNYQEFLVETTA